MNLYSNGCTDLAKQVNLYKSYIDDIEYTIKESRSQLDLALVLSDIQKGFYNTNQVRICDDDSIEYTGTSPCLVEISIWALFNREVTLCTDYHQQRYFVKSDKNDVDVVYVYRVKTYFRRVLLPFAIPHELQDIILQGELEYEYI